jgi:Ca-activated chloride channel family protein
MTWLYSLSLTEFFFIGLFLVLYAIYFFRTFFLAKQLNTTAWAVIPKFFLRGGYLILLLIALLGPSFGDGDETVASQQRDFFLLVDVSKSMDASDIAPSRLERVKYDIRQLTDTLAGDRFGLMAVADEAFILSPLTADHDAVKRLTQDLQSNVSRQGGTSLCTALELALQKYNDDPSTRKSSKAIVLFSDGENFGPCDRLVLGRLKAYDIALFTVGVGTEGGSSIRQGGDFVRDDQQQIVRTRLDRTFLQKLATATKGRYIEADANSAYLSELVSVLRTLRRQAVDQQRIAVQTNKYYYFLAVALLLIVFDLLFTVRTFRL